MQYISEVYPEQLQLFVKFIYYLTNYSYFCSNLSRYYFCNVQQDLFSHNKFIISSSIPICIDFVTSNNSMLLTSLALRCLPASFTTIVSGLMTISQNIKMYSITTLSTFIYHVIDQQFFFFFFMELNMYHHSFL